MKTYLITYDLINPQNNLSDLAYAIALIAVSETHVMPHVRQISTNLSASDITDHLSIVLGEGDRVMVTEMGQHEAFSPSSFAIGRHEGNRVATDAIAELPNPPAAALPC